MLQQDVVSAEDRKMYLRKITSLKNVGKFHKAGISGGEYKKYTLFFAGNGRGKTTLCSILRSFQRNDPTFINERQTLGESSVPDVWLLLDGGNAIFSQGSWNATGADHPTLHIITALTN